MLGLELGACIGTVRASPASCSALVGDRRAVAAAPLSPTSHPSPPHPPAERTSELLLPFAAFLFVVSGGAMVGFRALFPDNIVTLNI